jgi:hypothetical protein
MVSLEFFTDIILPAHHGPGVDSAPNRNEYQECFLEVKVAGAYGWQPYHLHVLIVLKSGSLNLLEPSGPVQACNGIAVHDRWPNDHLFKHKITSRHWGVWIKPHFVTLPTVPRLSTIITTVITSSSLWLSNIQEVQAIRLPVHPFLLPSYTVLDSLLQKEYNSYDKLSVICKW